MTANANVPKEIDIIRLILLLPAESRLRKFAFS